MSLCNSFAHREQLIYKLTCVAFVTEVCVRDTMQDDAYIIPDRLRVRMQPCTNRLCCRDHKRIPMTVTGGVVLRKTAFNCYYC